MSSQSAASDDPFRKLALAIGFLTVAVTAFLAHESPAAGYELSIYTMTPDQVWVGLLVAMSIALAVAFVPGRRSGDGNDATNGNDGDEPSRGLFTSRLLALGLGGLAMTVFAALPIIRGYRFFGHHDALTHLGWARAIAEGTIVPFDLYYPGIHTVTVLVNAVLGTSLEHSLMLTVFLSLVVFWVFVPLCIGTVVSDRRAVVIATFSSFLLLPITTISMFMTAHAMSQAVLFSALLFYLFVKYLRADRTLASVSAVGIALAVTSIATVVYHPQLVAHLIVVFLGISLVQFLARRIAATGRIASQTPMYGQSLFLVALFLVWTSNHGFFGGIIDHFLGSAVEFILAGSNTAGDSVAMQGASLGAIGGSLVEIFLKLFLPQLVFSILAGGLILVAVFVRGSDWLARIRPETLYFGVALVGLVPLFGIYFLAPDSTMYFRVFGLMMVFVTLLGALAIYGLCSRFSGTSRWRQSRFVPSGQPLLAVGFALLLLLSLAAVFSSPYTYTPTAHVSDQDIQGYETTFDDRDAEVDLVGLRNGPNRFDDAVNGNAERMRVHRDVPESTLGRNLTEEFEEDRYLVLTQYDYDREVIAYGELRYSDAQFSAVENERGVSRIHSTDEFERYYVDTEMGDT
ncbi:MFS transporter [Natrialba sp. PRR66]|uniref:MFS transporter n=1 Tax=Natrialba sp. PRR66 TaxID=3098146 RepID=UPI002B1D46B2|nr:MFS transporter [Natrialba sp. PRR66]